jgi:hydroxymethylpyrimidine/phosphomethylpyrimidine kinase
MDARPHEIRNQIVRTRATLDLHLDQLDAQLEEARERMVSSAQKWGMLGAVAAVAAVALVVFWRRQRRPASRHLALAPPAL